MHYPPDLSLASSYIPACLCIMKCAVAFLLFIFAPQRGWIGLCCLLVVDRILWNHTIVAILDVNAVIFSLVCGLMIAHTRAGGAVHMAAVAVEGAWALVSALQVSGVARMPRSQEIMVGACAVAVLSCLHQAQERVEFLALRAFVFVIANATLPYLSVMLQQSEADTYVNVCRTLLVLMGELEVACGWVVVHLLCIGYQIRVGNSQAFNAGCVIPTFNKRRAPTCDVALVVHNPSPPDSDPSDEASVEDEAALLREALSARGRAN